MAGLNPPPTTPATNVDWRIWARSIQPFIPVGLLWRGIFDAQIVYRANDVVFYNNALWALLTGPVTGGVPGVDVRWEQMIASSAGEANTASNLGAGAGLFKSKVGVDLQFKSLTAGGSITITPNADDVAISSTGEANTASNVGAGAGVFKQKTGVDLELKSLTAGGNIVITPNADDISISCDGEANTVSNIGTGVGLYKQKTGVDFEFKTLIAGTNITLTPAANEVTIDASGGGYPEALGYTGW